MHRHNPAAAGFYRDDVILAVRAKFAYDDKPEIFQVVLGDILCFARAPGERKQGVTQGRPRTLYSLQSLSQHAQGAAGTYAGTLQHQQVLNPKP